MLQVLFWVTGNTAVSTEDSAIVLMEVTLNPRINKMILESDMCLDISKASWHDRK